MTKRDEARTALWRLIEEKLPGDENINARHELRLAAINYAQAAAFGVIAAMTIHQEGPRP